MQHLALIMSGNRRWARENKLKAAFLGYDKGVESIKSSISFCLNNNIKYLSLYTFSFENFRRPEEEKDYLFKLLAIMFKKELKSLIKEKINVRFVGDRSKFPIGIRDVVEKTEERTKDYDRLYLNLLFCYGGQQEIVSAAKKIASKVKNNEISLESIDTNTFRQNTWFSDIPEPDLIIRTGSKGELRLSNFLSFQSAYSEFMFLDEYWPEMNQKLLERCINNFKGVKRNFGA